MREAGRQIPKQLPETLLQSLSRLPGNRMLLFLGASALTLVVILANGYRVQWTGSGPRGIWQFKDSDVTRGAWVAVCPEPAFAALGRARDYLSAGPCAGNVMPMLKRVAALPGDVVEIGRSGILVNGTSLPQTSALPEDSEGRLLPHPPWGLHTVLPETLWVVNPRHDSFDSRYFGPVDASRVLSVADAVLVLDREGER